MYERPIGGPQAPSPDDELAPANAIGTDERRMHVRAYNYWVSLLDGRPFPTRDDIDLTLGGDFADHSVLLDFRDGVDEPRVPHIGALLQAECGVTSSLDTVAAIPPRSLLSRLTDHCLQIIANRSPIGFEAEFVGTRGTTMMYRGILMPFSSDGEAIDFVYGVINWKEVLDEAATSELRLELSNALKRPEAVASASWADGPGHDEVPSPALDGSDDALADRLADARALAERARVADGRGRDALYAAVGRAHDVALAAAADPEGYAELLADNGLTVRARAPMTPIAKLVFGADHDKTRLAEVAATLTHAASLGLGAGEVAAWIAGHSGGLKGVVAAARAEARADRPARTSKADTARQALRALPSGPLVLLEGEEEFVLLLARRIDGQQVGVVQPVTDAATVNQVLARLA